MHMRYFVKEKDGKSTSLALDSRGNYSISTDDDPEPTGYTNHKWGSDSAEWREVTAEDVRELGHFNYDFDECERHYDNQEDK